MLIHMQGDSPKDIQEFGRRWPVLVDGEQARHLLHTCPWPLPNLKPVTEADFWRYRTSWTFQGEVWSDQQRFDGQNVVGHGVPYDPKRHTYGRIMLYLIDHGSLQGGGFAVLVRRHPGYSDKTTVEYYTWQSCQHEFDHKNIGRCLHRYTCKKCGYAYEVDSSD